MELGEAYKNQLKHDDAVRELLRAVDVDPTNAAAHFHLAENFIQLHRPLDARTHAARAAALEPGNERYRWLADLADGLIGPTEP